MGAVENQRVKLVTDAKVDLFLIGCLQPKAAETNQNSKVPASFCIVKSGSPQLDLNQIKALRVNISGEK